MRSPPFATAENAVTPAIQQREERKLVRIAERKRSIEWERKLAAKPSYTATFVIIAIVAAIVGFILAHFIM